MGSQFANQHSLRILHECGATMCHHYIPSLGADLYWAMLGLGLGEVRVRSTKEVRARYKVGQG